jgi:hypothetical protein
MILGVDPLMGRDEHDWDAVAGEDLRHLDPGRPGTEHNQAPGQLAGGRRFAVRPRPDLIETLDVLGDRRIRADRDEDRGRPEMALVTLAAHNDVARSVKTSLATDDFHACGHEVVDVPRVVRPVARALAHDHPVAEVRRLPPWVVAAPGMDGGGVEQRLRRHAGPERAGAAEQLAVDDRHARAAVARDVRRGLAGLAGADDDEIEGVGHRTHSAQHDSLDTSRLNAWAPILSASAIVG